MWILRSVTSFDFLALRTLSADIRRGALLCRISMPDCSSTFGKLYASRRNTARNRVDIVLIFGFFQYSAE